ncbi:hypothetical protein [Paraburkholderia rhynchosiae]|uniref:Uncharacterized protein n=1 Tax=Paraburkholderia rhynchosiae TaxID=487049 RepID=A0A2N7WTR0_9BURK|nr:hypothetical protein [Paraburkholderia rhynchosiae]PMS32853.1 hypothetical protein C0Z16_04710 [Paraburkholderia rhynchosiae]CAB3645701.1 hypothetical protein LMG27174_00836 [Paraburkholderia rhynchosiae]
MSLPRSTPRPVLRGDRNECPVCLLPFNSTAAFSKHKTGEIGAGRRCRTVSEMLDAGMAVNTSGFWVTRLMDGDVLANRTGDDPDDCGGDRADSKQPEEVVA